MKKDVMDAKLARQQAAAQNRRSQVALKSARKAAEQTARIPRIRLTETEALFDRRWLHKFCHNRKTGLEDGLAKRLTWRQIGTRQFASFDELEKLLDSGDFGLSTMGDVEIFHIGDLDADLMWWEKAAFGLPGPKGVTYSAAGTTSLPERFRTAKQTVEFSTADPATPLGELPEALQAVAWAAQGGHPGNGAVGSLEEALPIEIGYYHRFNQVLYIRPLAGDPAWLKTLASERKRRARNADK